MQNLQLRASYSLTRGTPRNVYTTADSSVNMYTRAKTGPSRLVFDEKHRVSAWVAKRVGQQSSWGDFYAMGAEHKGQLTAGLVFNGFTNSNATVHMAVSRPSKLFAEMLDHGVAYAFDTCKLLRLTALVEESNTRALRLNRHIGFQDEAVLRKAGTDGQDIMILVLWPENYTRNNRHG